MFHALRAVILIEQSNPGSVSPRSPQLSRDIARCAFLTKVRLHETNLPYSLTSALVAVVFFVGAYALGGHPPFRWACWAFAALMLAFALVSADQRRHWEGVSERLRFLAGLLRGSGGATLAQHLDDIAAGMPSPPGLPF